MFIRVEVWTIKRIGNKLTVNLKIPSSRQSLTIDLDPYYSQVIAHFVDPDQGNSPGLLDLFIAIAKAARIKVNSIEISSSGEPEQYSAIVHFVYEEKPFSVEINIAEALILGFKVGIPIFIEAGISDENGIAVNTAAEDDSLDAQIARFEQQMHRHVVLEEYEDAARIRDQIKYMKDQMGLK